MAARFYVVTLNALPRPKLNDAIEAALATYDWLRFSHLSYYIYAEEDSAERIYDLLKPLINDDEHILVVEVHPANRHGWASQVAVEWLGRVRS